MAKSKKYIVVRLPPSARDYLEKNIVSLAKGASSFLSSFCGLAANEGGALSITDQTSINNMLSRVLERIDSCEAAIESGLSRAISPAYSAFRAMILEDESIRDWPKAKFSERPAVDRITEFVANTPIIAKDPLFESKVVQQSFAIFTLAYYLLSLGGATPIAPELLEKSEEKPLWALSDYELDYTDHLVVRVGNIIPNEIPPTLASLQDPYGTYHDIVFVSALLAGIHTGLLKLKQELSNAIYSAVPVAPPPDDADFEKAFYSYQKNIVRAFDTLSKRISIVADIFTHLVTVIFAVDPSSDREQFGGKDYTFADVRLRPGTYWVHANFLTILPDDKPNDVLGTTQRNDVAFFTDRSFIQAPALRVSKYHLYRLLADPRANRKEYYILARSMKRVKQSKEEEKVLELAGLKLPQPTPSKIEYELLSIIPISPEVIVRRKSENYQAHVVDVRDTFGLDNPQSHKEVLDTLYLLARAYAPSYAVLYNGGVVGKDQYLALIASMLSYLSPTLSLASFDRKYDPRVHTLLYGIKGVGKTYLFEQYAYHWPYNTLFLFAGVRISEAKLLGGAMQVRVGRSSKLVFQPGEIINADGGMIMIDELDRLTSDSSKRPIADAIATVMASGYAPARHVLSDSPAIDVRVHSSVFAAANPIGLKSGQYVEEMLAAMFILNDEIREHYKSIAPEVVEEIERKFFEDARVNLENLSGRKLIAELEYLASDTPYTFIHNDFYSDPTLHKYIDRVTFAIPMYTMVGEPPLEFIESGRTPTGDIVIHDTKVADGAIRISHKALLDFTLYNQTVSPFAHGDDDSEVQRLLRESTKISAAWRKASSITYAQKIRATADARETMRVFLRTLGAREAQVAYRLAHTILKLYDETELKKPYLRAILELINLRDSLLYSNPSGYVRAPIPLPEAIRTAIRDILLLGESTNSGSKVYYILPEHIEAVYVDVLSRYVIRIPDKGDAPFDAVEHFQNVIQRIIHLLQAAGVLVNKQTADGDVVPALAGQTPEDLVKKLSFRVNKQGYLHVYYDGTDLGSAGKVV